MKDKFVSFDGTNQSFADIPKEVVERKIDTCYNFNEEIGCVQTNCRCEQEEHTPQDFLNQLHWNKSEQETLEEVGKNFIENEMKFSFNSLETKTQANRMLKCVEFGAKWQAERMYSEEDLKKAFEDGGENTVYDDIYGYSSLKTFSEWVKQFKNKQL